MYYQHLIVAAQSGPVVSPGTARMLGYGVLALAILWLLNSVFGKSKNNG